MEGENFESAQVESVDTSVSEASSESYDNAPDEGIEGAAVDTSSERDTISATSDEGTTFELFTDPTTGKVEFRARTDSEEEEGPSEEEDGVEEYEEEAQENYQEQPSYQEPQQPSKYTVDEFSYALANNIVDESRVPQEFQAQYADFKISQAKAAYNARIQQQEQQRQMVAQQMQVQASPEARIEANKNFYANLESEASRLALQDLGIKESDLEDLEYDDNADAIKANIENAKNWHKQRLMNELQDRYQREQAYKYGQQQLYSEIGAFTQQAQKNEKHFKEIDAMMATAWQDMPTKYGAVVQNALQSLAQGTLTRQQAQVIQKYYEDTRKLFYAQANGLSSQPKQVKKKPPIVEKAGNGQAAAKSGPDYNALRKADNRGKTAWLANFMKDIQL